MGIYETYLETKKLLGKSFYDDVTYFFFYVNVIVRCRQEMAALVKGAGSSDVSVALAASLRGPGGPALGMVPKGESLVKGQQRRAN